MSTPSYRCNVPAPTLDPEPNPRGTSFNFFDVELHVTVPEDSLELELPFRFPHDHLLTLKAISEHAVGLKFRDVLSVIFQDVESVTAILTHTVALAVKMDRDTGNSGREAVRLILDVEVSTLPSAREDFQRDIYRVMTAGTSEFEGEMEITGQFLKRGRVSESTSTGSRDGLRWKKPDEMLNSGCSISLEDFGSGDETAEIFCQHMFHWDCIVRWLETSNSCPHCRYQIPVQIEDGLC